MDEQNCVNESDEGGVNPNSPESEVLPVTKRPVPRVNSLRALEKTARRTESMRSINRPLGISQQLSETMRSINRPLGISQQLSETINAMCRPTVSQQLSETMRAMCRPTVSQQLSETMRAMCRPTVSQQLSETMRAMCRPTVSQQLSETMRAMCARRSPLGPWEAFSRSIADQFRLWPESQVWLSRK